MAPAQQSKDCDPKDPCRFMKSDRTRKSLELDSQPLLGGFPDKGRPPDFFEGGFMSTHAVTSSDRQNFVNKGIPLDQVDAMLEAIDQRIEQKMQNYVTKDHLEHVLEKALDRQTAILQQEVGKLRTEMVQEFTNVRNEMKLEFANTQKEFSEKVGKIQLDVSERYNKLIFQIAGLLGLSIAIITMLQKILF